MERGIIDNAIILTGFKLEYKWAPRSAEFITTTPIINIDKKRNAIPFITGLEIHSLWTLLLTKYKANTMGSSNKYVSIIIVC